MFITADQLLVHAIGDYVLQSDWMATEKTSKWLPAVAHALSYTVLFALMTQSLPALAFIAVTHFIIDRWRLARYVCWLKNCVAPKWLSYLQAIDTAEEASLHISVRVRNYPWSECSMTGYHSSRPPFLAVWLLIIADNVMHVLCNGIALKYLN